MTEQEEKHALDAESETRMRKYLRSRTWEEKVESIRRMNEFGKAARAAMRDAQSGRTHADSTSDGPDSLE